MVQIVVRRSRVLHLPQILDDLLLRGLPLVLLWHLWHLVVHLLRWWTGLVVVHRQLGGWLAVLVLRLLGRVERGVGVAVAHHGGCLLGRGGGRVHCGGWRHVVWLLRFAVGVTVQARHGNP